jgi:membrane associated rhomboid family serine protease
MSNFRPVRPDNFPPVVKNLIILNVLVWVAQLVLDKQFQLTYHMGLWSLNTPLFQPYQIFTHMFAHAIESPFHLLFNMLMLWMSGRILEAVWGPKRFLTFYFLCGIGAAVVHLLAQQIMGGYSFVIGASGAVFGLMAAYAMLFPNSEVFLMFFPTPIKVKWLIGTIIILDLIFGVFPAPGDKIARLAHVGGAVTGIIIVLIWNKTNRKTLY